MTRRLDLKEYVRSEPHRLSVADRDALRAAGTSVTMEPVAGTDGAFHLTPGSTVGAVEIGDLSVLIEPKVGIPQLLSLACYATSGFEPRRELFDHVRDRSLPDVLALALASAARRAFRRGLLHGYRSEEESLQTVRGRIRFDEQLRRHHGVAPPVEVLYDEFTEDIPANRLVSAAARRLGAMRLRTPGARGQLAWIGGTLENVSPVEYAPNAIPDVRFDRLNEHYREVIALSRLVLAHGAFESRRGGVRTSGFLIDMNKVFQEFVTRALREALCVSDRLFGEHPIRSLDEGGGIRLKPDLTWWDGSSVVFVGDAKYKRLATSSVPNADLYQLLAYVTALDLPGGLLVYAEGEADPATYRLRASRQRLHVVALDLSGTLDEVLERLGATAASVRALRNEATAWPNAA